LPTSLSTVWENNNWKKSWQPFAKGMGHALEVAWPDQPLMFEEAPDFSDRGL
jgi:hypothetical protein